MPKERLTSNSTNEDAQGYFLDRMHTKGISGKKCAGKCRISSEELRDLLYGADNILTLGEIAVLMRGTDTDPADFIAKVMRK